MQQATGARAPLSHTAIPVAFLVEGRRVALPAFLAANADDQDLCDWARSAQPGDSFPAFVPCECIAEDGQHFSEQDLLAGDLERSQHKAARFHAANDRRAAALELQGYRGGWLA